MSCYHPLRGFTVGINSDTGKKVLKVTSFNCDTLIYDKRNKHYDTAFFDDLSSSFKLNGNIKLYRESVPIPCGNCIGCRLDYSREWANRLMLENTLHSSSYFVTLTYNDEFLPLNDLGLPTLRKRDFQLFMKRLRKRFSDSEIRFYSAGEYGSNTGRPHYHAILFNLTLPPNDLHFYKRSDLGFDYFISDILNEIWGKGYVIVAEVSWQSCAYVARYVVKKKKGALSSFYDDYHIEPEFSLMSRKPGIAYNYIHDNASKLLDDKHIILSDGNIVPIPKYSHSFLEECFPDQFEDYKVFRQDLAENLFNAKVSTGSCSYLELCAEDEKNKLISSKGLARLSC